MCYFVRISLFLLVILRRYVSPSWMMIISFWPFISSAHVMVFTGIGSLSPLSDCYRRKTVTRGNHAIESHYHLNGKKKPLWVYYIQSIQMETCSVSDLPPSADDTNRKFRQAGGWHRDCHKPACRFFVLLRKENRD